MTQSASRRVRYAIRFGQQPNLKDIVTIAGTALARATTAQQPRVYHPQDDIHSEQHQHQKSWPNPNAESHPFSGEGFNPNYGHYDYDLLYQSGSHRADVLRHELVNPTDVQRTRARRRGCLRRGRLRRGRLRSGRLRAWLWWGRLRRGRLWRGRLRRV